MIAGVGQGGLGLPERDYYFRTDPKSVDLRRQYAGHVTKMAALAGRAQPDADAASQAVLRIETALAMGALDVVSRRDPTKVYHKMANADLQAMTPHFNWERYFRQVGAPRFTALNVSEPDFFTSLDRVLSTTPLGDVKAYLSWHVAHAHANFLSSAFVNEHFRFYNGTLQGIQELRPRWKRCVQYTDGDLGEALGQAFVKQAFGAQAKADYEAQQRAQDAARARAQAARTPEAEQNGNTPDPNALPLHEAPFAPPIPGRTDPAGPPTALPSPGQPSADQ